MTLPTPLLDPLVLRGPPVCGDLPNFRPHPPRPLGFTPDPKARGGGRGLRLKEGISKPPYFLPGRIEGFPR